MTRRCCGTDGVCLSTQRCFSQGEASVTMPDKLSFLIPGMVAFFRRIVQATTPAIYFFLQSQEIMSERRDIP